MKILKPLGVLILVGAVFAIGYWRGQSDPKANRVSSDHGDTGAADSNRRDPADDPNNSDGWHRRL